MSALVLPGKYGGNLSYSGSTNLEIQAIGKVKVTPYGLAEGDVYWTVPTIYAYTKSPSIYSVHPVFPWLLMEYLEFNLDKAYSQIIGHFIGVYPGAVPVYDWQPAFGEEPIQTHPNFGSVNSQPGDGTICGLAGAVFASNKLSPTADSGVTFNPDGSFKAFLSKTPGNLGGVASYLAAQGTYVITSVSLNAPDCSQDGTITDPAGGPIPNLIPGANWLQCPTTYSLRARVYDIKQSWKASGRKGWNSLIYAK